MTCLNECKESCSSLNGNIAHECGSCTDEYKCNPFSTDFRRNDHEDEHSKVETTEEDDDSFEEL